MTSRTLASALVPPLVAATICGWLIGYCLFRGDALAEVGSGATFGLIAVYYLQLRNMFDCKGTWFGAADQAPSETVTPLDEEKAFIKTIEEEEDENTVAEADVPEKPAMTVEMVPSKVTRPETERRGM